MRRGDFLVSGKMVKNTLEKYSIDENYDGKSDFLQLDRLEIRETLQLRYSLKPGTA